MGDAKKVMEHRLMTAKPRIVLSANRINMDGTVSIRLAGFEPESTVTLAAEFVDDMDIAWRSEATFVTDWIGSVDLDREAPVAGSYSSADPDGLFWSMAPVPPEEYASFKIKGCEAGCRLHALGLPHYEDERSDTVTFTATVKGRAVDTARLTRDRFPSTVTRIEVQDGRLRGFFCSPEGDGPHPGIVMIGGSNGGVYGSTAALLAAYGFAVLDLAYFNYLDLPVELAEIPLEYFRDGVEWLRTAIGHGRIALHGASRGGEGVLAIASAFPDLVAGVVALVPGDLYLTESVGRASWTLGGKPLPDGERPEDISALQGGDLEELMASGAHLNTKEAFFDPWYFGPELYERAAIPVERIRCPILFVSGRDDQCWDSFRNSERAVERLRKAGFAHPFKHLTFEKAGHYIVAPGMPTQMCSSGFHSIAKMFFTLGGTPQATAQAQRTAWNAIVRFHRDVLCKPSRHRGDR